MREWGDDRPPPFRPRYDLITYIEGYGSPIRPELERWRRLRWRWARARARRYVRVADLAYRRLPSPRNRAALERAGVLLRRVESGRPY